jgi:hypothetical protein
MRLLTRVPSRVTIVWISQILVGGTVLPNLSFSPADKVNLSVMLNFLPSW